MSDKRHCGYCQKSMSPSEAKTCGKCHRRVYCGRECQKLDWKSKRAVVGKGDGAVGPGQGHKDWCGVHVLEEDVHWEVASIEGKGKGLVAKTLIPPLTRICVGGTEEKNDDLLSMFAGSSVMPKTSNANFNELISMALGPALGTGAMLLNHDCDANACRVTDGIYKVQVIYSSREILPGEEICSNYTLLMDPTMTKLTLPPLIPEMPATIANARLALKQVWNIDCPSNCFCRTDGLEEKLDLWKGGYGTIRSTEECMAAETKEKDVIDHYFDMSMMKDSLKILDEVHGSQVTRANLLQKGFEVACRTTSTLPKALQWIKECVQIWNAVGHPISTSILRKGADEYFKDPTSYKGYLCIETKWGKEKSMKLNLELMNQYVLEIEERQQ